MLHNIKRTRSPQFVRIFLHLLHIQSPKVKMLFLQRISPFLFTLIAALIKFTYADTVVHDASFIPDAVLHITTGERKQSCVPVKEIVLVNGLSPGPELRFTEGKTVWIRVYNDIHDQNITMVGWPVSNLVHTSSYSNHSALNSIRPVDFYCSWRLGLNNILLIYPIALAWPHNGNSSVLRWHSSRRPMAYPS